MRPGSMPASADPVKMVAVVPRPIRVINAHAPQGTPDKTASADSAVQANPVGTALPALTQRAAFRASVQRVIQVPCVRAR